MIDVFFRVGLLSLKEKLKALEEEVRAERDKAEKVDCAVVALVFVFVFVFVFVLCTPWFDLRCDHLVYWLVSSGHKAAEEQRIQFEAEGLV